MSGMIEHMRKLTGDRSDAKVMKSSQGGVTIIEFLVCIAIIGVLTSLILPAVQMAREASRCNQCKHNLREVALAAHNFKEAHGHFPAGIDFQHVGPIVYLLVSLRGTSERSRAVPDTSPPDPNGTPRMRIGQSTNIMEPTPLPE